MNRYIGFMGDVDIGYVEIDIFVIFPYLRNQMRVVFFNFSQQKVALVLCVTLMDFELQTLSTNVFKSLGSHTILNGHFVILIVPILGPTSHPIDSACTKDVVVAG